MTDYNDGKWHSWNGGECPVHPESEVDVRYYNTGAADSGNYWSRNNIEKAGWFDLESWTHSNPREINPIVAFRVTKAYVEPPKPREFWLYRDNGDSFSVLKHKPGFRWDEVIHVREVLE